jgi:hypothetical protein
MPDASHVREYVREVAEKRHAFDEPTVLSWGIQQRVATRFGCAWEEANEAVSAALAAGEIRRIDDDRIAVGAYR